MEEAPQNPIESAAEKGPEKISRDELIAFAREKPRQDPEVEALLIRWLNETNIQENEPSESLDRIDIAIMHSVMKYRLGFLTKEEVIDELEQAGGLLASEYGDTSEIHNRLSQLLYDIEDDEFEVI